MSLAELRIVALTAVLAVLGAAGAFYIGAPGPFLVGPAVAVMVAGLLGLKLSVPHRLRNACFVVVGISMGATITPEVIEAAKRWPFSFFMVLVMVVVLLYVAAWMLQHLFRVEPKTAYLAATPGHLSFIISLSADSKGDVPTIAIIQSVRVMALTLSVPPLLDMLHMGRPGSFGPPVLMPMPVLAAVVVVGALLGLFFTRLRFPAGLLIGGLVASGLPHVSGFISGTVPSWIMNPAYVIIGAMIGTRFSGVSIAAMRTAFIAGAVTTVVVTALAVGCALLVSRVTGVPLDAALIAFAPGGLETMAAMAVMMHVDTTYVGAHHVLRLVFISFLLPWVMSRFNRKDEASA